MRVYKRNTYFGLFCVFAMFYALLSGFNHNAVFSNTSSINSSASTPTPPTPPTPSRNDNITLNDNNAFVSIKPLSSRCQQTHYPEFTHYKRLFAENGSFHKEVEFKKAVDLLYKQEKSENKNCTLLNSHINNNYRICVNFFSAFETKDSLVTLVTQLTLNRLDSVKRMALKWRGPMSVAFYVTSSELHENASHVQHWIVETGRRNIAVHFMIQNGTYFPINKLRNLALENARTDFIFQIDVDFILSTSLESEIQSEIQRGIFANNSKLALVAICLQALYDWPLPENKEHASRLIDSNLLQLYKHKTYWQGHGPSNITKWRHAKNPYRIRYCEGFEPFVVLKRSLAPRYPVQFLERHKDKISQISLLHNQGFQFHVLPNNFIVHVPHSKDTGLAESIFDCATAHYHLLQREMKLGYHRLESAAEGAKQAKPKK